MIDFWLVNFSISHIDFGVKNKKKYAYVASSVLNSTHVLETRPWRFVALLSMCAHKFKTIITIIKTIAMIIK